MSSPALVYLWVWGAVPMGSDWAKSFQVGHDFEGHLFQRPSVPVTNAAKLNGRMQPFYYA